ncbi:hypothetical protein [Vibrio maritimus]|uniref:hypothetical protein n=1 Tax=Vibrio maritimus TaxID=990268 RepID=UPI001F3D2706|nr:hypothetical protein [Vibrio maritimus]
MVLDFSLSRLRDELALAMEAYEREPSSLMFERIVELCRVIRELERRLEKAS